MMVESKTVPSDMQAAVALDDTDQKVVALWLAQRPWTTTRSYLRAWRYLQIATGGVELRAIQLPHLQAYAQSLRGMKVSSQITFIAAIQSLFGFACKIGYLPVNLGTLLRRPAMPVNIAERIVDEADIRRMLALTTRPRDATLLRLAYVAGLRIAELSGLRWRCFAPRENGAVLSVIGKGGRLRHIFLPDYIASAVAALRDGATDSAPIFLSQNNNALSVKTHAFHRQTGRTASRVTADVFNALVPTRPRIPRHGSGGARARGAAYARPRFARHDVPIRALQARSVQRPVHRRVLNQHDQRSLARSHSRCLMVASDIMAERCGCGTPAPGWDEMQEGRAG